MTGKDKDDGQGEELAEVEAEIVADMTSEDSRVEIGDRVFILEVPATKHVIWFINAFSSLARRSQGKALDVLGSPSPLDVIFGIGEALTETDLVELGVAALQFDNRKEGRKFIRDNGVPLAEIVQAIGISVKKSQPLFEQLKNVFTGLVGEGTIEILTEAMVRESLTS